MQQKHTLDCSTCGGNDVHDDVVVDVVSASEASGEYHKQNYLNNNHNV